MNDLDELITEARKCAPGDDATELAVIVHRLADALESVRTERDAALARIAEAAKLHRKRKHCNPDREDVFVCDECTRINRYGIAHWPCPTAVSLGLNEGEGAGNI